MMEGQIYIITCGINGKQYVGQTNHHIKDRISDHFDRDLIVGKAFKKHNLENFIFQMIEGFDLQVALDEAEKMLIKDLNTISPNGYNIREGGNGGKHHEETKRKMSKVAMGRKHSEETKKKISKNKKGEKNYFYGKHLSEEHKRKIGESGKGRKHLKETKKKISESRKGEKNPFYGKHLSEETKRKLSESQKGEKGHMYGKHLSEKTKRKMSESLKGERNHMYGKKHSEETKQKISEAKQDQKYKKRRKNGKATNFKKDAEGCKIYIKITSQETLHIG